MAKTVQVRMLQSQHGPGIAREIGDTPDVDEAEAKRMIAAGIAEPIRSKAAEKTTPKKTAEKTA